MIKRNLTMEKMLHNLHRLVTGSEYDGDTIDNYLKVRNNLYRCYPECFFVDPLNGTIYYVSKKGLPYRFCQLDGIGGAGSFLFAVFAEHISDDLGENYLGEMVYPPTAGAECLMDGYLTWDENGSEIADAIEEWEKKNL